MGRQAKGPMMSEERGVFLPYRRVPEMPGRETRTPLGEKTQFPVYTVSPAAKRYGMGKLFVPEESITCTKAPSDATPGIKASI